MSGTNGRSRRTWRVLLTVLAVCSTGLVSSVMPPSPASAAPTLPDGFSWIPQPSGQPAGQLTDFVFLPSGGLLSTGKSGSVRYVAPGGASREVLHLTVDDRIDAGLLSITLANDYAESGAVYLFYARPTASGTVGRLSRWTADDIAAPTSLGDEQPVLEDIPVDFPAHIGGSVVVASDDTLWVSVGDTASLLFADPLALRAQDLHDPHGKLLHIYPDGSGVASNPFYDATQPDAWISRVFASGFRELFRTTLRPGSNVPYVGEVGWNDEEELDVVAPGRNYGWPCWEGNTQTPGHRESDTCRALYADASANVAAPLWSYPHAGGGASVTGGVFYTGTSYPEAYRGAYFFGDYSLSKIWTLTTNDQDQLIRSPETNGFASGIGGPVRFRAGPGDDLFTADINTGNIWRLRYTPGNRDPMAVGTGTQTAPGGLTIAFDSSKSFDPDGDTLTYQWDFGDGSEAVYDANPTHTYPAPSGSPVAYTAVLTVGDGLGGSHSVNVHVVPGNHAPALTLTPPAATTFAVDDPVPLSASATDVDDGAIPAGAIAWSVVLHHCPSGTCHLHPGQTGTGATFEVPFSDHGTDTHMEITATVTDAAGVATSRTFEAEPEIHTLTVGSSPPGVVVDVNGSNTAAGSTYALTALSETSVAAPACFGELVFDSWSDGGARTHTFAMPRDDLALTAHYLRGGVVADVTTSPSSGLSVGTSVKFRVAVQLTPDAELPLSNVAVAHPACDVGTPTRTGGDGDLTLEVGETWTYTCQHELTAAEVPLYRVATTVSGTSTTDDTFTSTTVTDIPPLSAIGHYYFDLGGPSSFLGAAIGPEQPVAGGRMQRFEGGTIYWSQATGAHEVHGAILALYNSFGGPAHAGFPTSDEAPSPGGRISTFEQAHIYWTPSTGAHEVRGIILAEYLQVGGPSSMFGYPLTDESPTFFGTGRYNHFQGGSIYWSPATGAHEVHGAIRIKWSALGWEFGFLGFPLTNETPTFDGVGRWNGFQGGTVYWSPDTDAHEVHGAIRALYDSLGGPSSSLGYPISDESGTFFGTGRYNHFQGGSIYWSPATGAHEVHGAIRIKWSALGWEFGFLGFPLTNETPTFDGVGRWNGFQGGTVYWSPDTDAHEVHGAIRALYDSLGGPSSSLGYPISDETVAPDGVGRFSDFEHGSIDWTPTGGARVR